MSWAVRNRQQIGWDFSFLLWYIAIGAACGYDPAVLPEENKRQTQQSGCENGGLNRE